MPTDQAPSRLSVLILFLAFTLNGVLSSSGQASGRNLPPYEADVSGPLPFPEEINGYLDHELEYLLGRQNEDGSWTSAQPEGNGRTTIEAGGTVGNFTLTSVCAYSLRHFAKRDLPRYEQVIGKALVYVTSMVSGGKLRSQVTDAPWHYIYGLRFLASEYPRIEDEAFQKRIEDACAILIKGLKDTQGGTYGQRSIPYRWEKRSSPGMIVEDSDDQQAMVVGCDIKSPAFAAGVRIGDRLLTANGIPVDTAVRYAMNETAWMGGDTVTFTLLRKGKPEKVSVKLPDQYPKTTGLRLQETADGLKIAGFDFLSNRDGTLKMGDTIVKAGGMKLKSKADLETVALHPNQPLPIVIRRNGELIEMNLACPPVPVANLGVVFPKAHYDQSVEPGLPIAGFTRGSTLRAAGLGTGDRLLKLDGSIVLNRAHYHELIRSLWSGKRIEVTYFSKGKEKTISVNAGELANEKWLKGYHGLKVGRDQRVAEVAYGSPADRAGARAGDLVLSVNGIKEGSFASLIDRRPAGASLTLVVQRGNATQTIRFTLNRQPESIWDAHEPEAGGGWGYLTHVKGGNSFTTADALRELLNAKANIPKLEIPDEMINRAFLMLSKLRSIQPNSKVESYRYDTGGSFWRYKDIRADIGRINSAELACLKYTDAKLPNKINGYDRTQSHLQKTLSEWLVHRGILDLVKFPNGHGKLSIAPWFWMYSYRTTLEAADYLTVDDKLKEEVRRTALKALFKHMEFRYERKLEGVGWIVGGDTSKELHDSCQTLDGLATMKHLLGERLKWSKETPKEAVQAFRETRYGEAYKLIKGMKNAEAQKMKDAIGERFSKRLKELKEIHQRNAHDGLHHLRGTMPHFAGLPGLSGLKKLAVEWEAKLPRQEELKVSDLGNIPGQKKGNEGDLEAWSRILKAGVTGWEPSKGANGIDALLALDPKRNSLKGDWTLVNRQLVSPSLPYARMQLSESPGDDYRVTLRFTRLKGDCLAVVFPVSHSAVTLVVSGWGGKTSGLAFVDGKDADRNQTTRDGRLENGKPHELVLEVRSVDQNNSRVSVKLNGKPYLNWEGPWKRLSNDPQWAMESSRGIGVGGYEANLVIHGVRIEAL
jgi:S1-C subfamily serine protease